MFWFFSVSVLFLGVNKHCEAMSVATSTLESATMGFDPISSNILIQPDPAVRGPIFQPIQRLVYSPDTTHVVNPFMNELQETQCIPRVLTHRVRNYEEYLGLVSTSFSFATPEDSITEGGRLNFSTLAGYGSMHHEAVVAMQDIFKQTGGEVIISIAECITHTVTIDPFQPPAFTTAFQAGLARLEEASTDQDSDAGDRVFADFVRSYGTHFPRITHLGAKILLGVMFPGRATTAEDNEGRQRCVEESSYETLTPGSRRNSETIYLQFSRVVSEKCGSDSREVVVIANGPLPEVSLRDWSSSAKLNPRPIYFKLQKISAMFRRHWIESVLEQISRPSTKKRGNTTGLFQFFEEKSINYCPLLLEQTCQTHLRGCGFNSRCPVGSTCTDQPDTELGHVCSAKYGGIVIIGSGTSAPHRSEAWGVAEPVVFPRTVVGNTVSIVSKTIYSCGGNSNDGRLCTILREDDTAWSSISLPWGLYAHSAVSISDEIWFFLNSKLYVYHTKKAQHQFKEYNLVFAFTSALCAVTNTSHTFIVGVGATDSEIWINSDPSKPSEWEIFGQLMNSRVEHACLWVGDEIFVTGGRRARSGSSCSSAEILNLSNNTIWSTSPMVHTRRDHKMAVIHDQPAVIGGIDGTGGATTTIENYDKASNTWHTLDYTLRDKRSNFGLAQYRA